MASPYEIIRVANLGRLFGLKFATQPVCCGHTAPGQFVAELHYDRPPILLIHGPRGGGKSLGSSFATHLDSLANANHSTRILGGSLAQSLQIYEGLRLIEKAQPQLGLFEAINKTEAKYVNGSTVGILAASPTSVRGPHVSSLKLDEVDEIEDEIRESAVGMAMQVGDVRASIAMTSTYHRIAGPMSQLIGKVPTRTFCVFEVLERCPDERSGKELENCPACPIMRWCHSDRERHPQKLPKAKRSNGHYTIDSLIQKVTAVSLRVFESDYLCLNPRAAGAWFNTFDEALHVSSEAEYDRSRTFHIAIDPGVHTGAVWFQVQRDWQGMPHSVNVFGDYHTEEMIGGAEANATAILVKTVDLTGVNTSHARVSMDPAGKHKTAVGVTVRGEYVRAGCTGRQNTLESWPSVGPGRPKADVLELLSALLMSASGQVRIKIHPRCTRLIAALRGYCRAKRDNQWMDYPEDPQHPHEEMIDCLCGGLTLEFPEGRAPAPSFQRVHASQVR